MFFNVGEKIKVVARVWCFIGIVVSVVTGLALCALDGDLVLIGLIITIAGSLISWISSLVVYGFGQMVSNSDILANKFAPDYTDDYKTMCQNELDETTSGYENDCFEDDLVATPAAPQTFSEFAADIKAMSTEDLELIVKDQRQLYNREELAAIDAEYALRVNK